MTFTPIKWVWDKWDGEEPIIIERVSNYTGTRFAIRRGGDCMDRKGKWEPQPIPSERTNEWLNRFRFYSFDEAAEAVTKHCKPRM